MVGSAQGLQIAVACERQPAGQRTATKKTPQFQKTTNAVAQIRRAALC